MEEQVGERVSQLIEILKEPNSIVFLGVYDIQFFESLARDLNVSDILKTPLELDSIKCIAVSTPTEFSKLGAENPDLSRLFHPIFISELSPDVSIRVLHLHKIAYETHHHVTITDEAIEASVRLSNQHLPDRSLPTKALDLMDEAAALLRRTRPATFRAEVIGEQLNQISQGISDDEKLLAGTEQQQKHAKESIERLIKSNTELEAELAALQTAIASEPDVLYLTAQHIADLITLWQK